MNNALLLIDLISGSLTAIARIQMLLKKAALENRDVTDTEIKKLRDENNMLENELLNPP